MPPSPTDTLLGLIKGESDSDILLPAGIQLHLLLAQITNKHPPLALTGTTFSTFVQPDELWPHPL